MDDLTPNDLSHLSDEEFNALCPQGYHAPGPEPLSPAAEAVLDAALPHQVHRYAAAAALRAAEHEIDAPLGITCLPDEQERWYRLGVANFKRKLLAIATELEGQ